MLIGVTSLVACALWLAMLWPSEATSPEESAAVEEGRTLITYWNRHTGHEYDAHAKLVDEFNHTQDKIYVRSLSIGARGSMEKLLTSISGGAPPDVCSLDSPKLIQLAAQGCFMPLDDWMAQEPELQEEAFFPHTYQQVVHNERVYAIPTTTDVYCLLWNKDAFRKAGLDPEVPPKTLAELEEFAAKLTIQDEDGIQQMGFIPWRPFDMTEMWGVMFGGVWYDYENHRTNVGTDQAIIDSYNWQATFAKDPNVTTHQPYAIDPGRLAGFEQSFGAYFSANSPFYSGKLAMITEGEWQCTFIPLYAPDLNWGVAPIPQPEGAPERCFTQASIVDCIPRGARNPEASWAFLKWFYTKRGEGLTSPASDYCFEIHNIPTRPSEAKQSRFMDDPKFRVFVDQLLTKPAVGPPITPVAQFYRQQLRRTREYVVFRETTAEKAVVEMEAAVNGEQDRVESFLARFTQ
jgi:ABC-type glycerol-3-phosphate transport system substrate-binding protein